MIFWYSLHKIPAVSYPTEEIYVLREEISVLREISTPREEISALGGGFMSPESVVATLFSPKRLLSLLTGASLSFHYINRFIFSYLLPKPQLFFYMLFLQVSRFDSASR